jgi:glycosyltransferase involved in cell wall biosynthesis
MTQRILHLIPALDPYGAEKQLGLLAPALLRAGFDVQVCAFAGGPMAESLRSTGIQPTILERRWTVDPRLFWNLKRLVDHFRPDVIHAWKCSANAYGLAASIAGGTKRLVAGYRGVARFYGSFQNRIDREIGRRSATLVANAQGVRDFYVKNGLPDEKFQIISPGVECPAPATATRQQILAELGLPDGSRLIGLVGCLLPHKRVKDAIWAADLLKVIRKDVHLLIFGDGPHRDRLQKFRDQVCIRDHVHFLGQRGDVGRFLPHFDLLWSTSNSQGRSIAILEAMAAGVPVIAGRTTGTTDLITNNQTGLLVPVGDRAGFAREADRLLDNPDFARRLGRAGREHVRQEFVVEKMVEKHLAIYQQLF